MSESKSTNLLKAAKELNIGLSTAVEFLGKKGHQIDGRPNTKLSDEMYDILLKEFQGDKIIREEAKNIVIGKIRRDDVPQTATERPVEQPSARRSDFENDEILIKNANTSTPPPVVEKVVEAPKEEKPQEIKEEKQVQGVKIVGKINLDDLNKNRKPKAESEVEEKPKTEPVKSEAKPTPAETKPEEKVEEKPVAKTEIQTPATLPASEKEKQESPLAETAKPVDPVKTEVVEKPVEKVADTKLAEEKTVTEDIPAEADDEVIRAKATQLSGPKIIGKIDLPIKKTQPVASSSNAQGNDANRRKRKRKELPGGQQQNRSQGQQGAGNAQQSQQPRTPGQGGNRNDNKTGTGNNRPIVPYQGNANRPDFRNKGRDNTPTGPRAEPTDKDIQDQIKATLARLSGAGKSGKFAQRAKLRRQKRDDFAAGRDEADLEAELNSKVLKVTEFVTANELATMMDVSVTQVIATCMSLGMFVSINQRLDAETLSIVADEFGYEVQFINAEENEINLDEEDDADDLQPRSPIVTVMGHVDHGKTSLLDFVRKANVIAGEAGGITQHIGAYEVQIEEGKKITFLDTPGHEAFTAMRARGAKVTDVAIIVIAADDSVMPQTVEAINHAQAANVPIVFAFSKIDKPGANTDRIREQLSAMNILVEDWGGKYQCQEISAKSGLNVDLLLEKVLLEAELLELKANPDKRAVGTVIEAMLDKGRGYVTTVLIQAGTLQIGDPILAGSYSGRVKALYNERGQKTEKVGPSAPVQILGFTGAPQAGDKFNGMETEVEARELANKRLQLQREQGLRTQKHITLDEIGRRLAIGNFKELNVIIKGDVDGSVEALSDSLLKLSTEEIQVKIVHKAVGQISESDVLLATASDAIIIGFQVRPSASARKLAEHEAIDIRLYSIIYKAIEEIKAAMEGMLAPEFEEKIIANVEIRETFKISKVGTIAGCMVLDGKINRNSKIRIIREGVVVHTGELASLKRFKDDVKEVAKGFECGLNIANFNDIKEGDVVEAYENVEVKRKL